MIRCILDGIAVKPDEAPDMSGGGIILPESAKDKPTTGVIIAKGPGRWCRAVVLPGEDPKIRGLDVGKHTVQGCYTIIVGRVPMAIQIGDRIAFPKYAGTWVEHEGETIHLMREADILCILE